MPIRQAPLAPVDEVALARFLGVAPNRVWWAIAKGPYRYRTNKISKKSGGTRTLHIPDADLAMLQRKLLRRLLNRLDYPAHVAAYVPGRSLRDAAQVHANSAHLIVLDIQDFFGSTTRSHVRKGLQKAFDIQFETAHAIATIGTVRVEYNGKPHYVVPQGAPTSGALANIAAMAHLDPCVLRTAERHGLKYTRYADDLALSCTDRRTPAQISQIVRDLTHAVRASGYFVNYDKLRAHAKGAHHRLLGICVNEHPNVPLTQYKQLRAEIHYARTAGVEAAALRNAPQGTSAAQYASTLRGRITHLRGLRCPRAERLWQELEAAGIGG